MTGPGADPLAALFMGNAAGGVLPVFPGYCQSTAPITVQITGALTLTGLKYLGVAGTLAVGPVLLLRSPDGAPIILGNLNS